MNKTVTVIGIGYIGQPLVAVLAKSGFNVIGLDIDKAKVKRLQKTYKATIKEPKLDQLLRKYKKRIIFTTNYKKAVSEASAIFITVGTPIKKNGKPNYNYLKSTAKKIGKYLERGKIIILKSTVTIGTTKKLVKPLLEKYSGLKAGKDFYLAFCPERTVEGKAVEELQKLPKIIGGINKKSAEKAKEIISKIGGKCIIVSSPEVAEICKIIDNYYRAVNIALANEIGFLCERVGLSMEEVKKAVNDSYERTNIFSAGLGADGPCLYKDMHLFQYSAKSQHIKPYIVDAAIKVSEWSDNRIADACVKFVEKYSLKKAKIALIGLAFKGRPETDDTRGSPAVFIYKRLIAKLNKAEYSFYDPIVKSFEGKKVAKTLNEAIRNANIILFLNNHPKIMNITSTSILKTSARPLLVIDAWGNLKNPKKLRKEGIEYFRIGDGKISSFFP